MSRLHINACIHGDKDSFRQQGERQGLKGEALEAFQSAGREHEIVYSVDPKTGDSRAIAIDGHAIIRV